MTAPALLADAKRVADAVLYEGYLLYPYRSSSAKNQVRWQFGVLGPRGAAVAGAGEAAQLGADCLLLVESAATFRLEVHVRFLQVQCRQVEEILPEQVVGPVRRRFRPVDELRAAGTRWLTWQEAAEQEVVVALTLEDLRPGRQIPVYVPGGEEIEIVADAAGHPVGRLVRTRRPLEAELSVHVEPDPAAVGLHRLALRLTNEVPWAAPLEDGADRDAARSERRNRAAERSFVGTHLILAVTGATFASVIDPPAGLEDAARACRFDRCWPVLIGTERTSPVVLGAPIILEDRPAIAPQSQGDLFDATEIDEILTLRVQTLTDDEKEAARATDSRAAAIVDRCDNLSDADMSQLHGVLHPTGNPDEPGGHGADSGRGSDPRQDGPVPWWDPGADASVDPGSDAVRIAGVPVSRGSRVLLRPSRRADAQDLFLAGLVGLVAGVHLDVDGGTHVAVTLEDDPAADLHEWYGRYYYFGPEELEPLSADAVHDGADGELPR